MSQPGGLFRGNPIVRFESLWNGVIGFQTGAGFNSGFAGGNERGVTAMILRQHLSEKVSATSSVHRHRGSWPLVRASRKCIA